MTTVSRSSSLRPQMALVLALVGGCRELPAGSSGGPGSAASPEPGWFVDVTTAVGIDFTIDRSVAGDYFMPDSMAAGCGLLDYDDDGDLDLYLVNAFRNAQGETITAAGANRLYRQEVDGHFTDVTDAAGVGHEGYGMGVAAGDIDNDGDVDLYVTNYGLDCLYRNNGDGTFTEVTDAAGITNDAWSTSAAFGDFDADGFLDLYVTNYVLLDLTVRAADPAGRPEYPAPGLFEGVPDVLYRNNGDGTFTDVSRPAGIADARGPGMGVVFTDLDQDGLVDIYVSNDGQRNFAWIQRTSGHFIDRALEMGLALGAHGRPEASMGIAYGDCDGDDDIDLFLTHFVLETNTLYRQVAPGLYEDATMASGLGKTSVDYTGFGTAFLDVELDGDLDLVVVNGGVLRKLTHAGADLGQHWTPYAEPNQVFVNDSSGRFTLTDVAACGALCRDVEVSRGLATGDLDQDGDLDLVVTNGNGTLRVYRNDTKRAGHWLMVRVVDPALRRDVLGAVVEVKAGPRRWRRPVRTGHSYLSSSEPAAHFGLGDADVVDQITVRWPNAAIEVFEGGAADRRVRVERGTGRLLTPLGATGIPVHVGGHRIEG